MDKSIQEKKEALLALYKKEHKYFICKVDDSLATKAIEDIVEWRWERATIEVREPDHLIFKIKLDAERTIYLTLFMMDKETALDDNCCFSYFEGHECQINGIGSYVQCIRDIANHCI